MVGVPAVGCPVPVGPDFLIWVAGIATRRTRWSVWPAGRLEEIMQQTLPEYVAYMSQPGRADWAGPLFSPRDGSSSSTKPGRLRNLEILSRTTSGRVARFAITTDAGVYHVRGDRVRWGLKPADGNPFILRSALFEVELVRDGERLVEVGIRGRGYGHGKVISRLDDLPEPYPYEMADRQMLVLLTTTGVKGLIDQMDKRHSGKYRV